jgi:hypothetical protein
MKFRSFMSAFIVAILAVGASLTMSAQNTYERLSIIEEFTSATCGPCVPASETLNEIVKPENGMVSVRFHMHWPAPNDPWNIDNPTDNSSRQSYYAVTGIPNAQLNGSYINPTNGTAIMNAVQAANAMKAPLGFEIVHTPSPTGGTVSVKVKTNIDLKAHKLHVAVVTRYQHLPNLPSELANSNGETEFYDAMNKMLPNAGGTTLNMSGGGEETFNFTYTSKAEKTWPKGQQYIVAYVQATSTKEVLNAGSTLEIIKAGISVQGPAFEYIGRGASKTKTFTLTNSTNKVLDVTVGVANYAALTQAGWQIQISDQYPRIAAGGSTDITVTTTSINRAYFAGIELTVTPDITQGIAESESSVFGYLTEDTKVAVYYGSDAGAAGNIIAAWQTTHANDVAYIPYAADVNQAFPPSSFSAAIFPVGFTGRFNIVAFIPAIQQMQAAGKGVWLHAPVGMAVSFHPNNQSIPGYPEAKAWFESIGLTQYSTVNRNDGTYYTSFSLTGVPGDPIGRNWTGTANQPTSQWPFSMVSQDLIRTPSNGSVSWVYADNNTNNISGVRWSDNKSKVVFSTFGPEHIAVEKPRTDVTQYVLDWLLQSNDGGPKITVDNSTLNFGNVMVGNDKEMSFTITNSGDKDLTLNSVELSGTDAIHFDITGGYISGAPVTVRPAGTYKVTVSFAPGQTKSNYMASVVITANAAAAPVQLRGNGTTSSVETDVVSETGSIAMSLVGQHPIVDQSSIALVATQPTSVTIVDVAGNTVATLFNGVTDGTETLKINAASLSSGTYSVVASNGAERAVLTIVVTR